MCFVVFKPQYIKQKDYANHQMTRLRPYILEHAAEFEWKWFKSQYYSGLTSLAETKSWLEEVFKETPQESKTNDILLDAVLSLILKASRFANESVPETFQLDTSRLVAFYNEWQDVTILASLLVLFRQASGPKCTTEQLTEAKKTLWVLLNDPDTTMSHISLQIAHTAGTIRTQPFTDKEREMLSQMLEKSLAPDSKLYELIQKRVGENLKHYIVNNAINKDLLGKHGLTPLETEVVDLAKKIQKLVELNRAIFGSVYIAILQDFKDGNDNSLLEALKKEDSSA